MKKFLIILIYIIGVLSCKKQLDVKNPNQPTPSQINNESNIISLAQGGIYVNGFRNVKYTDDVYGYFWSGAMGFHEIMADVIQVEAANAFINQLGCPNKATLDGGAIILNPNSPKEQIKLIREINNNSNLGGNPLYYEWAYMYNMIASSNSILTYKEQVKFPLNGDVKKMILEAWAYWWKGFAYSRVGSIYYAGIVNDSAFVTNGKYVSKEKIIEEANANLDKAIKALNLIKDADIYAEFMAKLIPKDFQVGKGAVPTIAMWKRNINTLKARNILVNKPVAIMTNTDWNAIIALANNGIEASDNVFTIRSNEKGDLISGTETVSGKTQSTKAGGGTYKLSERWVQEFKVGDKRKDNNIIQTTTWIGNSDRGNVFNTRFALVNGGLGNSNVVVYANTEPGAYELYIAGTYEENELMKAEAKINTGDIEGGLLIIDAIRTLQGAGLAPVKGTSLSLAQAKEELRKERRVVCAFRGLSFYDARRWGVINPISQGGGRTGSIVLSNLGVVNTNSTIEYNFLDYWDVPDNELAYNPAVTGTAPVKNPKQ